MTFCEDHVPSNGNEGFFGVVSLFFSLRNEHTLSELSLPKATPDLIHIMMSHICQLPCWLSDSALESQPPNETYSYLKLWVEGLSSAATSCLSTCLPNYGYASKQMEGHVSSSQECSCHGDMALSPPKECHLPPASMTSRHINGWVDHLRLCCCCYGS